MLHAQIVIRCAGLQALDGTHVRMIGHKPHELQHLIALVEPPHLMTLELGDWPAHLTPVYGQTHPNLTLAQPFKIFSDFFNEGAKNVLPFAQWLGWLVLLFGGQLGPTCMKYAIQQCLVLMRSRHQYAVQDPQLFGKCEG